MEARMSQNRPFYGWKLLVALATVVAINQGGTYLGAAVINAPMARDLGMSRGTLGLGSTFYVLTIALTAPLVARMVNSFGTRTTSDCCGAKQSVTGRGVAPTCSITCRVSGPHSAA